MPVAFRPPRRPQPRFRGPALAVAATVLAGAAPAAMLSAGPALAGTAPTAPPPVTVLTSHASKTGGDFFISPFGDQGTYANGPEILSPGGKVIWFHAVPAGEEAADFRAQTYHGQPVLTWWQGTGLGGLSQGTDYIYNDRYQQIATVQAGNGYSADGHEFLITPWNTALILSYATATANLTSIGGPADQTVIDGIVQEIDIRTGKVLFQWNSADHVPYGESEQPLPASASTPWDWFHVNAVKVARNGSLLIDARDTWTTYDVSLRTGHINWQARWQGQHLHRSRRAGAGARQRQRDLRLAARPAAGRAERVHVLRQRELGHPGAVHEPGRHREAQRPHQGGHARLVDRPARGPGRRVPGQRADHPPRRRRRRLGRAALLLRLQPVRRAAVQRRVPGRSQHLPRLPVPLAATEGSPPVAAAAVPRDRAAGTGTFGSRAGRTSLRGAGCVRFILIYYSDMKSREYVRSEARLGDLIAAVRSVTRQGADWTQTADLVALELRLRLPGPDILTAEQRYGDPLGYRCHLLHADPDGSFSIVALVWRPGQATPVHDHVAWCVTGVIQGTEHEERYELRDDGWLAVTGTADSPAGDVVGLAPPGDIHRVTNRGAETAISLHIYGTDLSRLGSSIRRVYTQPIVADEAR